MTGKDFQNVILVHNNIPHRCADITMVMKTDRVDVIEDFSKNSLVQEVQNGGSVFNCSNLFTNLLNFPISLINNILQVWDNIIQHATKQDKENGGHGVMISFKNMDFGSIKVTITNHVSFDIISSPGHIGLDKTIVLIPKGFVEGLD